MAANLYCLGPFASLFKQLFESPEEETITGFALLQKKHVWDQLRNNVSLQLISISSIDPSTGSGELGEAALIQKWKSAEEQKVSGESKYRVDFKWDLSFGTPGAFLIRNLHCHEFFLKSLTIEIPGQGNVHFACNSWVYPASKYKTDRIFFSNKSYLPADTPLALAELRNKELENLRGDGTRKREEWDKIYDYDVYNDLGNPDKGEEYKCPVLGGSKEFPYRRRGQTGRHRNKSDPATESRLGLLNLNIYVPRDERFGSVKMCDMISNELKSALHAAWPLLKDPFHPSKDFHSFEDVKKLYTANGESLFKFPTPQVIAADEFTWREDEEFTQEMLSGVNPLHIRRLHVIKFIQII